MKRLFSVFALGISILSPAQELDWKNTSNGLAVYGLTSNQTHVFAITDCSGVLISSDEGTTWSFSLIPQIEGCEHLRDIQITEVGILLAVGENGKVIRSEDGGASWSTQYFAEMGLLRDLTIKPNGAITAVGSKGRLMTSFDDGSTWEVQGFTFPTVSAGGPDIQPQGHFHYWKSDDEVYILGQALVGHSTDGGQTWMNKAASFSGFQFYEEIYFLDENVGYLIAELSAHKTTDGGQTWSENLIEQSQSDQPLYRFRTLRLTDNHWLTVAHREGAEVWETLNQGISWNPLHLDFTGEGVPCIIQLPSGRILFGDTFGSIYYTDDLGITIHDAMNRTSPDEKVSPQRIDLGNGYESRPLSVQNTAHIAVGAKKIDHLDHFALFMRDGMNWDQLFDMSTISPQVQFVNEQIGFMTYQSPFENTVVIMSTKDGGQLWKETESNLPYAGRLTFLGEKTWLLNARTVTDTNGIQRTKDGGITWTSVTDDPYISISVRFSDFSLLALKNFYDQDLEESETGVAWSADGGATWQKSETPFRIEYVLQGEDTWELVGINQYSIPAPDGTFVEETLHILSNTEFSHLKIYPNPTKGKIEVQNPGTDFSLRVFDLNGRTIMDTKNKLSLDLKGLMKGIYFVEFKSAEGSVRLFKILKN
ncbi:MAG: T9SS type A sorting domain-containing protein [Cyclobacteriaceae bacterium]